MFYEHIILAKKGPLARVWLAAHWDKKITKAHVFETSIEQSVQGIMQPKVKLALRTSGHLLLGVVRIYSRKAKYLLADCNEAFVKIKMAFRPGMVDLPEGHREANVNAITLPEVFHDFDTALPQFNDIDIEAQFTINQSRADEITMRENYGSMSLSIHDDGFGDIGFEADTPDLMRGPFDSTINDQLFEDDAVIGDVAPNTSDANVNRMDDAELVAARLDGDDGFGDEFGQPGLFEGDLFGEPQLETNADKTITNPVAAAPDSDDDLMDHFDDHAPSPGSSIAIPDIEMDNLDEIKQPEEADETLKNIVATEEQPLDQSTLLHNEDEGFALAPIDASAYKGITKTKRKRKLIVDEVKNISGEEMKAQLANTSDIVTTLDLAPPTKRLMYWKETGGVEKLFSLPSRTITARVLFLNYQRHLISRLTQLEDFSCLGPSDLLALDQIQQEQDSPMGKKGRKQKLEAQVAAALQQQQAAEVADTTTQSLPAPEAMREPENQSLSLTKLSLDLAAANTSVAPDQLIPTHADNTMYQPSHSPAPMFGLNTSNELDNMGSLNDFPLNHALDNSDDFNHGDFTPGGLHHGQLTPHHAGIEGIESLPNIPADEISSILKEADNMPPNPEALMQVHAAEWNEYDMSINQGEQLENETTEQFEERVLNKRAAQMFYVVKSRLNNSSSLNLSELTTMDVRKQAAQKFYSLLVLKKFRALEITQMEPYADINITRGPLFDNPKL